MYDGHGANASSSLAKCSLPLESDGNAFNVDEHGCLVTFDIQEDMKAPVYVYYQLDNFYQNHRRYVQSRSDAQLRGEVVSDPTDCEPLKTITGVPKFNSIDPEPVINDTSVTYKLNPCGLIANSLFNDIFWVNSITTPEGTTMFAADEYLDTGSNVSTIMDQSGIAWESDISTKFKNLPPDVRTTGELYMWENPNYRFIIPERAGQAPEQNVTAWTKTTTSFGVQDEHFIVWMRTAGLPNFRKLYGRIDHDLVKGTKLSFLVSSNFVVQTFDGKKYLVLSTTSWFGGKNPFLGIAYITVGSLCMILAILFFAKHKFSPRKLGDTRYLVWKNNAQ